MVNEIIAEEVVKAAREYGNVINDSKIADGTATCINGAVLKMLITTFQLAQAGGTLTQFDEIISGRRG